MKNLFFALCWLLCFAACSDNNLVDELPAEKEVELPLYAYSFSTVDEDTERADTRVEFDAVTRVFEWNQGDQAILWYQNTADAGETGVFGKTSGFWQPTFEPRPFTADKDGRWTTFTTTDVNTSLKGKGNTYIYKAYFPYDAQMWQNGKFSFRIPQMQYASYQDQYDVMCATVTDAPAFQPNATNPQANPSFRFEHLTTQIAFYFKDPDQGTPNAAPSDFVIRRMDIQFPEGTVVAGDFEVDPRTDELQVIKRANYIHVEFRRPVVPSDAFELVNSGLISCLPFTVSQGESFTVTVYGSTKHLDNIMQEIVCTPKKDLVFAAGHLRKIALNLKSEYNSSNCITPVGAGSIQELLSNPSFAPTVTDATKNEIYGSNLSMYFKKAGQVLAASSSVWDIDNNTTSPNSVDKAIVMDNRGSNYQSAFYMPVKTVLPNFYEPSYNKDLRVHFKAYILIGGSNEKISVPLIIAANHCNDGTWKDGDRDCKELITYNLPMEQVHYTRGNAPEGYPAVNLDNNLDQGWIEYSVDIPASKLPKTHFIPNADGTEAYIGFKINSSDQVVVYLKDIVYETVNKTEIDFFDVNWMARFKKMNPLLSEMSLPGSHDTATSTIPNAMWRCQSLTISEQLKFGVRVFDLRPAVTPEGLMIYHGSTSTGVSFDLAMQQYAEFLRENPTETCIVTMQCENGNEAQWQIDMGAALAKHKDDLGGVVNGEQRKLFAHYRPQLRLNDVRGQIVMLSRTDYDGLHLAGKITPWSSNASDEQTTILSDAGVREILFVQDHFNPLATAATKKANIKDYFAKAASKKPEDWLFNYLSQAGNPKENAVIYNYVALEYLNDAKSNGKCVGVVFMDFAGDPYTQGNDVVHQVIWQNFEGKEEQVNQ